MNAVEYQSQLIQGWAIAHLVRTSRVDAAWNAANRADSIGAVLDPTLYRTNAKRLQEDMTMLRVLSDAKAELIRAFPKPEAEAMR